MADRGPAKIAELLLGAPNPTYAIAHYIGEQNVRIDALARSVTVLQSQMTELHAGYTREPVL